MIPLFAPSAYFYQRRLHPLPMLDLLCTTTSVNYHMQTSIDFNTRKRRRIDQQHSRSDEASGAVAKRQKTGYPGNNKRPSAFWDGLSTTPLTKGALKELDRRNAEALRLLSREPSKRRLQPITRATVARWKSEHRLYKPLSRPSDQEKRFARLGGPDLTDLRGVRDSKCVLL